MNALPGYDDWKTTTPEDRRGGQMTCDACGAEVGIEEGDFSTVGRCEYVACSAACGGVLVAGDDGESMEDRVAAAWEATEAEMVVTLGLVFESGTVLGDLVSHDRHTGVYAIEDPDSVEHDFESSDLLELKVVSAS